MKEKTIEKIPYLGLQKISRIKSVKYIGVTAVKVIGHKKHLLLEVYENKKESKKDSCSENRTYQEGFRHILAGKTCMDTPAGFILQTNMDGNTHRGNPDR